LGTNLAQYLQAAFKNGVSGMVLAMFPEDFQNLRWISSPLYELKVWASFINQNLTIHIFLRPLQAQTCAV